MKLPRNISGNQMIKAFERLDYRITRQTGSHVRLE
ncbi:type II toxin-antitoxin system HicA family toxin [Nitrosomonas marina]|nr:type II toxin-antitoxin system HicA family toxin [Nitrosomonas marina]